ncbi:DUF5597 domain-containing protein [Tuanshanicoccus lijuaniae]|uniref:DUF5597 domain-containing protein n=1 Tax=Aerococcaceae bacterium zg-1292 TaxID=2774330 RepID=UPI0019377F09|nr:DUF5597 domain-containing protein [Aerococcaceae bacterium zg-1292]QQA36881.1 DUF5597 domain-containing protein [Aerococcaceae bacterium zg-1292]
MIPEIKTVNKHQTLFVNNKPFFCYAGEVHNSSASNLSYMESAVWPNLKGLNLNTLILPIYWECLEPSPDVFDFSLIDGLIKQARENNMHLILIWFGLWKNAESMYVPSWIKKDSRTYFRAKTINGNKLNSISPFCEAAIKRDSNAFKELMAHIKKIDQDQSTVLMIQVENEIGLLGSDRDYSTLANQAFESAIPASLAEKLNVTGNWRQSFGENAPEFFMAYHYAQAVEFITQSGQAEYPLPCYTNAWLRQYPWSPGTYPSGGPVVETHPIWKATAPSLFTLAPDIYVPYVSQVLDEYTTLNNPLVVPEVRKDSTTASYALYAFANHNAICYSPFGIEEITLPPEEVDIPPLAVMQELNIDPSAFNIRNSATFLSQTYELIENLKPLFLKDSKNRYCFIKRDEYDYGRLISLKNYNALVSFAPRQDSKPIASGGIIELSPDIFVIFGMMATLTFSPKPGENVQVEIIELSKGKFINNEWQKERILNGDEKMRISLPETPSCFLIELYKY